MGVGVPCNLRRGRNCRFIIIVVVVVVVIIIIIIIIIITGALINL